MTLTTGTGPGRSTTPRTGNRQPNMEAVARARAVTPGTGGRERDAAERAPEDLTRARVEAREQSTETEDIGDTGDKGSEKQQSHQDQGHRRQVRREAAEPDQDQGRRQDDGADDPRPAPGADSGMHSRSGRRSSRRGRDNVRGRDGRTSGAVYIGQG